MENLLLKNTYNTNTTNHLPHVVYRIYSPLSGLKYSVFLRQNVGYAQKKAVLLRNYSLHLFLFAGVYLDKKNNIHA